MCGNRSEDVAAVKGRRNGIAPETAFGQPMDPRGWKTAENEAQQAVVRGQKTLSRRLRSDQRPIASHARIDHCKVTRTRWKNLGDFFEDDCPARHILRRDG